MTVDNEPVQRTTIAAHRGGAALWPENSPTAFRGTTQLPVDLVEFDVHAAADGHLVVHHDATVDRMTDGHGSIAEQDFAGLRRHTIRGTAGDRIPELAEVLDLFAATPIRLRIELKVRPDFEPYPGLEAAVVDAVRGRGLLQRTVFTSFYLGVLERCRAAAPDTPRIWLVHRTLIRQLDGLGPALDTALGHGEEEIALHHSDLTPAHVETARHRGLRVGAYAINHAEAIRNALSLRVSSFTTDVPDLALAIRAGEA